MLELKRTLLLVYLFIAVIFVVSPQLSLAQFLPCRIVNLNLTLPEVVQVGQLFQVTSTLTVSCDPSILPVIRVDLVDAGTSRTLSSTSIPYYPSSSSFTVSVVNQATARNSIGSWALQVQAYVLSGMNGQSAASTSQLFQLNIIPYAPPVTTTQTSAMTTQISSISPAATYSSVTQTTSEESLTEALESTQISFNTSTRDLTRELLPAGAIILVGLAVFVFLVFARRRRGRQATVVRIIVDSVVPT